MIKRSLALIICLITITSMVVYPSFQSSEEISKKELVIGRPFDIKTLNPGIAMTGPDLSPLYLVYETLAYLDADYKPQPRLADSWEVSEDAKTWTFHLRKEVKFSDDTPFNAAAVKFSFEYINKTRPYNMIKSIEVLDDYAIRFILTEPDAIFLYDVILSATILSPTAVDEEGEFIAPIGTGPFKFEELVKGQKLVYVRNEGYWGDAPKLEKVILRVIPDHQTRAMALEAGEIDVADYLPVQEILRLKKSPDFALYEEADPCMNWIGLNSRKEPLDDARVRKAINHAIDVEGIINSIIGELAVPATQGALSSPCHSHLVNPNLKWYGYNPEKAEQLLAQAGWEDTDGDGVIDKDGGPFKVTLTVFLLYSEASTIAEVVQAQLKEVGIDVEIRVVEKGAWYEARQKGEYDMITLGGICSSNEPSGWFKAYFHSQSQWCIYKNESLDSLVGQLYTTVDSEARLNVFWGIQEMIDENAPGVFLYSQNSVLVMNKHVKGFEKEAGMPGGYSYARVSYIAV